MFTKIKSVSLILPMMALLMFGAFQPVSANSYTHHNKYSCYSMRNYRSYNWNLMTYSYGNSYYKNMNYGHRKNCMNNYRYSMPYSGYRMYGSNMPYGMGGNNYDYSGYDMNTDYNNSQNRVDIRNFAFSPSTITVTRGTTVTWTNYDNVDHTVTSSNFDSGHIMPNRSYSYTFNTVGTYTYHCSLHQNMTGTVIVR